MIRAIVSSSEPVCLLGGLKPARADLEEAMTYASELVAADGGGDHALALGHRPLAVIGDMDSLSKPGRAKLASVLFPIKEQQTTDFDKALRHIESPLVLALGVAGGRFDHELAGVNVLLRHPDRPCIMIGTHSISFLCPPDLRIGLPLGMAFSLFPFAPIRSKSDGLAWPTDELELRPDGRVGTSNRVVGPVRLRPDCPKLLVILPREALGAVVKELQAQPRAARWRVPAE